LESTCLRKGLLRQRPALQVALAPHLARVGGAEGEAAWAAALLALARANAGPACLTAAAALDARLGGCGLRPAAALIDDAAGLCRRAGARGAREPGGAARGAALPVCGHA